MSDSQEFSKRKSAHLDICTDESQYSIETQSTLFEHLRFIHNPLPEINLNEIDLHTNFLGYEVNAPIFISSMTGGSEGGYQINRDMAKAAQSLRIPVGMGSMRILLRKPEVMHHFQLKSFAPDVPLFANFGAVQLREVEHRIIYDLLVRLEVDGIALHLNAGQELFQPGGDRDFTNVFSMIEQFCEKSPVPVIVKETGCGISPQIGNRLLSSGITYIDVAGSGGANWLRIEDYRLTGVLTDQVKEFDNWGIPTALNLALYKYLDLNEKLNFDGKILASGGIRTGMDVAKSIALGASLAGTALPLIRAYKLHGYDGVLLYLNNMISTLRKVCLLTGVQDLSELGKARLIRSLEFYHYLAEYRG